MSAVGSASRAVPGVAPGATSNASGRTSQGQDAFSSMFDSQQQAQLDTADSSSDLSDPANVETNAAPGNEAPFSPYSMPVMEQRRADRSTPDDSSVAAPAAGVQTERSSTTDTAPSSEDATSAPDAESTEGVQDAGGADEAQAAQTDTADTVQGDTVQGDTAQGDTAQGDQAGKGSSGAPATAETGDLVTITSDETAAVAPTGAAETEASAQPVTATDGADSPIPGQPATVDGQGGSEELSQWQAITASDADAQSSEALPSGPTSARQEVAATTSNASSGAATVQSAAPAAAPAATAASASPAPSTPQLSPSDIQANVVRIAEAIDSKMATLSSRSVSYVNVRLDPHGLGEVTLTLRQTEAGMSVSARGSAEAIAALTGRGSELTRALEITGIRITPGDPTGATAARGLFGDAGAGGSSLEDHGGNGRGHSGAGTAARRSSDATPTERIATPTPARTRVDAGRLLDVTT